MDDEEDQPKSIMVRVDRYTAIMDAADIGFAVLVERRDRLKKLMDATPAYPERDAAKMKTAKTLCLDGDIPLSHQDLSDMWRRTHDQIMRLAEALNSRFAEGVSPRYKA